MGQDYVDWLVVTGLEAETPEERALRTWQLLWCFVVDRYFPVVAQIELAPVLWAETEVEDPEEARKTF
jgi:hypothetical protein